MTPIAPGTLCMIVNRHGDAPSSAVGKVTTVLSLFDRGCSCGCERYVIDAVFVAEWGYHANCACRHTLQPILPPGVDTREPVIELLSEPVV